MKLAVLLGMIATLVLTTSCSSDASSGGPRLTAPGVNSSADALSRIPVGQPVSIGSIVVCLDASGSVELTSVELVHPIGIELTAFAVRPAPSLKGDDLLGEGLGTLASNGFAVNHQVSGSSCTAKAPGLWEIGVELRRTTTAPGSVEAFRIHYASHAHGATVSYPYAIYLCPRESKRKGCA